MAENPKNPAGKLGDLFRNFQKKVQGDLIMTDLPPAKSGAGSKNPLFDAFDKAFKDFVPEKKTD